MVHVVITVHHVTTLWDLAYISSHELPSPLCCPGLSSLFLGSSATLECLFHVSTKSGLCVHHQQYMKAAILLYEGSVFPALT
jgi:hypothetical protein